MNSDAWREDCGHAPHFFIDSRVHSAETAFWLLGERLVSSVQRGEHAFVAIRRFQVDDLSARIITVSGDQAGHALRVLRLKVGALVGLFDGKGSEVRGRITWSRPGEFGVEVVERSAVPRRSRPSLTLAVAMPKGPRGDWLVEKCAELGVSRLWPLNCQWGQVEPGEGKVSRWRRKAIEAAKQSGQSTMMDVEAQTSLTELIETRDSKTRIFFGEPHRAEQTLAEELMKASTGSNEDSALLVIIGPESGLTDEECAQIETAGGKAVSLGPTILRIETAAVAAAAICGCWTQRPA